MNWYYVDAGKQAGPVDDSQLEALRLAGKIQPDTLIWREGMAVWLPYREARPESAQPGAVPPVGGGPVPSAGANEVVCAECGRIFDKDSTIQYGEIRVCASCKPVFMQKLAEGAAIGGTRLNYAGFWTRFGAVFLDWILMYCTSLLIALAVGLSFTQAVGAEPTAPADLFTAKRLFVLICQLFLPLTYEVFFIGKYGATLGKMACKIKVVTADGGRVSYLRAFGRYFAKVVSALPCLIGYFMAAFDDEKRALHDRICNTRVILK
jgi:uncharacterized RDD family membrane protein YckC